MAYTDDMQIIELDSFITAFPVKPGKEAATKRRFMTLFAQGEEQALVGGTSYVRKVRSFSGQTYALKRLITGNITDEGILLSEEDSARITKGHADAFYEEYRSQLLVSHMRGFPKLYGYGQIGDEPAIIMEWVEGVSLRDFARQRSADGLPITGAIVAQIGVAVLETLYSIERLDSTLVHRDISPANIMIRTDVATVEEQVAAGEFDVCLIDFGSASAHEPGDPSFTMAAHIWRNGTPAYAAPEMLTQDLPHIDELRKSQAIDVFALCSVLFELYCGDVPWDLEKRPEVSPYRVKVESNPKPLEAREPADEPLVRAIMGGLAVEQADRPCVRDLLASFDAYLVSIGANGVLDDAGDGKDAAGGPTHKPSIRSRVLPVSLYTPDSTRLEVARIDDGGKRAGENLPAFEKPHTITRRTLVAGGLALAFAAIAGGSVVARLAPKPGYDFSAYPKADTIWDERPLYPAMQLSQSAWHLLDAESNSRVALATSREPGAFVNGLIRVYDSASDGYGFMTAAQSDQNQGLSSAWKILPAYANAGDFSQTDGLAAMQDADSGLWGYIDEQGTTRISPAYAGARRFGNGYAAVCESESGLWGIIDATGNSVLEARFANLGTCSEEGLLAAAKQSSAQWGFVGLDGTWAIADEFSRVHRFTEGLAACLLDADKGLWGYIDASGATAISARFSQAYPFADGLAPAKDPESQLWGLIDTSGAWHVEPRYLSLGEKTGELFAAHGSPIDFYGTDTGPGSAWDAYWKEGNGDPYIAYGYIDAEGNWVFKPSFGDTLIRYPEQ